MEINRLEILIKVKLKTKKSEEKSEVNKGEYDKDLKLTKLRGVGQQMPIGPGNFWNNMLSTVLLLIFITFAFSYLTENQAKPDQLSLSEVVNQVKAGEVKEIVVRGTKLEIKYNDETRNMAETKKETDASITESLSNLGVFNRTAKRNRNCSRDKCFNGRTQLFC